jgi:hypothetical protein
MVRRNKKEILVFIVSFLLTISIFKKNCKTDVVVYLSDSSTNGTVIITQNEGIRNQIAKKIRIFCWFMAKPVRNQTWIHLKKLWGNKCDRYVAMASIDTHIPGMEVHKLKFPEGRGNLWKIYLTIMKHLHDNFINDYDYFMKVDDDA